MVARRKMDRLHLGQGFCGRDGRRRRERTERTSGLTCAEDERCRRGRQERKFCTYLCDQRERWRGDSCYEGDRGDPCFRVGTGLFKHLLRNENSLEQGEARLIQEGLEGCYPFPGIGAGGRHREDRYTGR